MPSLMLTDGQHLEYQDTAAGEPVIFLHSALGDMRQWDSQVRSLSAQYRCIRYDLMGYGKSSDGWEEFDPADNVLRLMDVLDIDRAPLIGSSMGGAIAIHTAKKYPDRVSGLVLAGTGMFGYEPTVDEPDPPVYHAFEAAVALHDVDRTIELADDIWLRGLTPSVEVPESAHRLFAVMNRERLYAHPWEGPEYIEVDDTERIADIQIPVRLIVGRHDTPYCRMVADYLVGSLPNARVYDMADCAHLPNLCHPHEFNDLLQNYLGDFLS